MSDFAVFVCSLILTEGQWLFPETVRGWNEDFFRYLLGDMKNITVMCSQISYKEFKMVYKIMGNFHGSLPAIELCELYGRRMITGVQNSFRH